MTEKVNGLDTRADNYIVKPFEMPELIARVRALLGTPQKTHRCLMILLKHFIDSAIGLRHFRQQFSF